ncbi:MAG TPA: hypothetical protein VLL52_08260, partial [Anaerolineae bacterium]|nr:hypothetical protein [Anaerolineae bacterium]
DGLLSWSAAAYADGYHVYRSGVGYPAVGEGVLVSTSTGLSWTDVGVVAGGESYVYYVLGYHASGDESERYEGLVGVFAYGVVAGE